MSRVLNATETRTVCIFILLTFLLLSIDTIIFTRQIQKQLFSLNKKTIISHVMRIYPSIETPSVFFLFLPADRSPCIRCKFICTILFPHTKRFIFSTSLLIDLFEHFILHWLSVTYRQITTHIYTPSAGRESARE